MSSNDPYMSSPSTHEVPFGSRESELRERAVQRLRARRAFLASAFWFVIINAMLIYVWSRNGGFFWPLFPLLFWGMGLVWQAVDLFGPGESEDRIQAEMRRLDRSGR